MERLLPIAEQLDRAAVELRLDHPLHNRLALILIDNAVEIMIGLALQTHVLVGGDFNGVTAALRRKARSRGLPDRLSVLTAVGELTAGEAMFVEAAHQHRNAAYHEGDGSEPFLRPLAFLYYRFACDYFVRFEIGWYSWSSAFRHTPVSRRYHLTGADDGAGPGRIDRGAVAALLLEQLPVPPPTSLQDTLADDAADDRERIVRGYRFLIDHAPLRLTAAQVLAKAQFDFARDRALEKHGLDHTLYGTPRRAEAAAFVAAHRGDFMPRYRALPHGSWSQSIARIRADPDPHRALVRFQRLRRSMAFLRDAIGEAAMRLEFALDRD